MNKFACSALALAAAGSVGFADPADDGEWLGLDQDLVDLHATTLQGGGPRIGALIRSYWIDTDNDIEDLIGADISGWTFQDVDIWLEGEIGDFDWRVSLDYGEDSLSGSLFGSSSVLEDAYATWHIGDDFDITWGQFKFGHTLSSDVDPEDQVLITRSIIGQFFDFWDHGVMVGGDFEDFTWRVAATNGIDSIEDKYFISGRAEYNLNGGAGGMKGMEGAVGAGDDIMATIGIFGGDEGSVDNGQVYGADFAATMDVFSLAGEFAGFDEDLTDSNPYSITASMVFGDEEFEGAVRYEDLDDDGDTTAITGGVNWYLTGRNAYWSLNYTSFDSDDAGDDGGVIAVGLNVGASR